MAQYNEVIGEFTPDKLIANFNFPILTQGIPLAAGQGVLKRGSVIDDGGNLINANDANPFGILCDDVDTTEATVAEVYVSGCFNKGALIVGDGYELNTANAVMLRATGIYVENIVD